MFERYRLNAAFIQACDVLAREGSPVNQRHIADFTRSFRDIAVADMKKHQLKGNQAAAALFINLMNTTHYEGVLKTLHAEHYEYYRSLMLVYFYFYNAVHAHPEYFERAMTLVDKNVFREIAGYNAQTH